MYIYWVIIGSILLYLDHKKANDKILSFAGSCIFCAIIAYKFPSRLLIHFICFALFTIMFYGLIKLILRKEQEEIENENKLTDYINKTAIVRKDIGRKFSIDGMGEIIFNNTIWQAKNITQGRIRARSKVKIVSKENRIFNVKVIEDAKK